LFPGTLPANGSGLGTMGTQNNLIHITRKDMSMDKLIHFSVRLKPELTKIIRWWRVKTGISVTKIVENGIKREIAEMEDRYKEKAPE